MLLCKSHSNSKILQSGMENHKNMNQLSHLKKSKVKDMNSYRRHSDRGTENLAYRGIGKMLYSSLLSREEEIGIMGSKTHSNIISVNY